MPAPTMPVASTPLRVLIIDDSESDALLVVRALKRGGYEPSYERVWESASLLAAFAQPWDVIVSDYSMPRFTGTQALALARQRDADIPFVIVSGAIGEDIAVAAMKAGAQDYVMKDNLGKLPAVVMRALSDAAVRRAARLAEANLRASEALLNSVVNNAADGILVISRRGAIEFVNPAVERMIGYKPIEIIGQDVSKLLSGNDDPAGGRLPWLTESGTPDRTANCEVLARHRDGSTLPVELTASLMRTGGEPKYSVVLRDVSERHHAAERIRRLAHYDDLTGLPNRVLFCQLLNRALHEARNGNRPLAVLFVDLDRFKMINDTLGHEVGDTVLQQVASRLTGSLRPSDTVARFAGDEFVVLVREADDTAGIAATAKRIVDILAQPFVLDGQEYHLSASVGISTFPDDSADAQMLLRNADTAMYRAKEQGKNAYQFHSPQMNLHSFERLVLERYLRRALEQEEFVLHYQPKLDLATGHVVGMEALLRWHNPVMGMISPDKFIPLAEETGLIVPIGEAVIRRACLDVLDLSRKGLGPLRVAVNLSARQLAHDSLGADISRILTETGVSSNMLEVEITESMVMHNPERVVAVLRELRSMGLHVAIDDFGTGYSSLGYLKRFPVTSVKIDRSFIKDIPADTDDVAITRAVIAMAHSLRLQVTAEGVETSEQLEFLKDHGCNHLQGYLFSRPLPLDEFAVFVRRAGPFVGTADLTPKSIAAKLA